MDPIAEQVEPAIERERPNLSSEDRLVLRETIARIERSISSAGLSEGHLSRSLAMYLVKVGLELQNTNLLLILAARLKLSQLVLTLQSTLQCPNKGKIFALSYVADYFHMNDPAIERQLMSLNHQDCDTIFDLKFLVKLHVDSNEWKRASEIIKDNHCGASLNRWIYLQLARHYEAMENFYEALINYKTSDTQLENSVRVIIKQFLDSSQVKLKEYCRTNNLLKKFWEEFSLFCTRSPDAAEEEIPSCQLEDDPPNHLRSGLFRSNSISGGTEPIDILPSRLRVLIKDLDEPRNWMSRRTIESVVSSSLGLSHRTRRSLSTEALRLKQTSCNSSASALFLCLDELRVASQLSSRFLSHSQSSHLNLLLSLPEESAAHLLPSIRSGGALSVGTEIKPSATDPSSASGSELFAFLNLGLLDEAMRCYCNVFPNHDDASKLIIDHLENLIAARHTETLDRIDPTIRKTTLSALRHHLISERMLITPVISIIIYCITIHTYKLDCLHSVPIPRRIMDTLESMFQSASDCLKSYSFNATNSLVQSTNILVTAVKDNLELISDSETIPTCLKSLVETVASRCLVESQFKQAATLYNQIEDHASAIKSLMRLGDIDTVMNYSLLVQDIAVNRLTINYLKHLEVDSPTIEEFINRSKQ